MQFDNNAAAVRDIEAVSQESNGSGATLGESLQSLDVEVLMATMMAEKDKVLLILEQEEQMCHLEVLYH